MQFPLSAEWFITALVVLAPTTQQISCMNHYMNKYSMNRASASVKTVNISDNNLYQIQLS